MFVSHPFDWLVSQLPQPALQVMPHAPFVQLAVPLVPLQVRLQLPQSLVVVRSVSQPLEKSPSQLPHPEAHTMLQPPLEQLAVPFTDAHSAPQAPQLFGSLATWVSQPSLTPLTQSSQPLLHTMPHVELEHVGDPFAPPHL